MMIVKENVSLMGNRPTLSNMATALDARSCPNVLPYEPLSSAS